MIFHSVLLRMRNVSDKSCRENQTTRMVLNNIFHKFVSYEIMWKNVVVPDRPQMTIQYGACDLHDG
jgi:hypothetical protein